jgi:hypothetical protein
MLLPILSSPDFHRGIELFKIPPFQHDLIGYALVLLFFYVHYYILIPRLYFTKKHLKYVISIVLAGICIVWLPRLIVPQTMMMGPMPPPGAPTMPPFFQNHLVPFISILFFSLLLRIYSRWKEIEQENQRYELSQLKHQINPHFLFNTLNVIYASSIEEKAKNTTRQVELLSDMLRYVLTENPTEYVTVQQELTYLKAYIELQENRCGMKIDFQISYEEDAMQKEIPSLLFIPFIENAFAYGVSPEEAIQISIHLFCAKNSISLWVKNKIVQVQNATIQHGIGITNTQKRLQLLFADNYTFDHGPQNEFYIVKLEIPYQV